MNHSWRIRFWFRHDNTLKDNALQANEAFEGIYATNTIPMNILYSIPHKSLNQKEENRK